jgi:predicted N-acetyltransferase YhbS
MEHKLISSPNFTIRPLETPSEIEAFCRLNAQTFRSDEDPEIVASRRCRYLNEDPDFHPDQLRAAFSGSAYLGGYIIHERLLCLESARLRTGCIGGVVTHPDYRHQGIATALMQEALAYSYTQKYELLLLHGIPNFYHQFGFVDALEDLPEHIIDRKLIPEQSHEMYSVRMATLNDAPALLALYQLHYGSYLGSFAPTRTLQQQEHLMRNWFQGALPLLALNSRNELNGYLMLSRSWNQLYAYEVAANTWPAALALLQYHSHQLDTEPEAPHELRWPLPPNSPTFYLLADHLPLRSEMYSHPDSGWMARPVHLPTLFQSLLLLFQERWQRSMLPWSGTLAFKIDNYTCYIDVGTKGIQFIEHPFTHVQLVSLSPQVFTQLLFSFRPVTWAINQPGQHIPEELIPVLNILFPSGQASIARSDSF